ncbi:MAG: metallophosphoesterase [Lachnospiraceae bacterium]|nr:metallophosphoesterase [Lachnospiraceae bacterium]
MSTYVMADLHGRFTELQKLLKKINFGEDDKLIIAGDICDRGEENYAMLKWMESKPANVEFVKGNHDEDFISNVDLLTIIHKKNPNFSLLECYDDLKEMDAYFDFYGTMIELIDGYSTTLEQLSKWADIMQDFPYLKELNINNKNYLIVHAGYMDEDSLANSPLANNSTPSELKTMALSKEVFYTTARDEALIVGGKRDTTIIAGHTPTISTSVFFNLGKVFRGERPEINSVIYNIDCGAGFLDETKSANMACIRLEDEEIFYLR